MKRRTAVVLLSILLVLMAIPGMVLAYSSAATAVSVDGKAVQTQSIRQQQSVLVPALFFRNMGAAVNWSEKYQAVTFSKDGLLIAVPSGKNYADYYTAQSGKWQRDYFSVVTTDRADGTYVSLRYVAEKLGAKVSWDESASICMIQTAPKSAGIAQNDDNVYWLYQLTEAESGDQPHAGKVAVAASVLNRVKSPDWPKTIKGVIFQVYHLNGTDYYQYSPVQDKRIYSVTPSEDTKAAVREALGGQDPSRNAIIFYNPVKTANQWVRDHEVTVTIGQHVFAK
jgi:hypothetical protein